MTRRTLFSFLLGAVSIAACAMQSSEDFAASATDPGNSEPIGTGDAGRAADAAAAPVPSGSPLCSRKSASCTEVGQGCGASEPDAATPPPDGGAASLQTCRLEADSKASCSANGSAAEGATCEKAEDCSEGLECVRNGGRVEGQCRAYCCAGTCDVVANSGGKTFCDIQFSRTGSFKVPVCMPVKPCKLFDKAGCTTGETCAVVNDEDGTTGCVEEGPAQVGQSCDEVHCGAGLTCLGRPGSRRCFTLCKEGVTTCPAPSRCVWPAPTFSTQGIGICVDSSMKAAGK